MPGVCVLRAHRSEERHRFLITSHRLVFRTGERIWKSRYPVLLVLAHQPKRRGAVRNSDMIPSLQGTERLSFSIPRDYDGHQANALQCLETVNQLLIINTEYGSTACFTSPSKITLKSPFLSGQLYVPTGGYALYRCKEELFGSYSVQSEWERYYQ